MKNLKEQYDEIVTERKKIIDQINFLVNDEKVKKYLELCNRNMDLKRLQKKIYKQVKVDEYSLCNHIFVNILCEYDMVEGRSNNYCGCIKCGLDQRVFSLMNLYGKVDLLTFDQQIMYSFMKNRSYINGIDTKVSCDLELAKAIYSRIKEVHPDIDDETARKYFEIALNDIRRIKVNNERKASRIRRLKLNSGFNNWN